MSRSHVIYHLQPADKKNTSPLKAEQMFDIVGTQFWLAELFDK